MLILALLPCRLIAPSIAVALTHSFVPAELTLFSGNKPSGVSPDLIEAAHIAEANANRGSTRYCWRYVKRALVEAHAVDSYPDGISAKNAGRVLTEHYGFEQLDDITAPEEAPVGAILVYGGEGHGHVEFKTEDGYVSDFKAKHPSSRPLLGVYVKGPRG